MITKISSFFSEVVAELKKVTWPTRQELIDAAILVVITTLILIFFISGVDFVLSRLLGIIIR